MPCPTNDARTCRHGRSGTRPARVALTPIRNRKYILPNALWVSTNYIAGCGSCMILWGMIQFFVKGGGGVWEERPRVWILGRANFTFVYFSKPYPRKKPYFRISIESQPVGVDLSPRDGLHCWLGHGTENNTGVGCQEKKTSVADEMRENYWNSCFPCNPPNSQFPAFFFFFPCPGGVTTT